MIKIKLSIKIISAKVQKNKKEGSKNILTQVLTPIVLILQIIFKKYQSSIIKIWFIIIKIKILTKTTGHLYNQNILINRERLIIIQTKVSQVSLINFDKLFHLMTVYWIQTKISFIKIIILNLNL
jgi:hypothetical protein